MFQMKNFTTLPRMTLGTGLARTGTNNEELQTSTGHGTGAHWHHRLLLRPRTAVGDSRERGRRGT